MILQDSNKNRTPGETKGQSSWMETKGTGSSLCWASMLRNSVQKILSYRKTLWGAGPKLSRGRWRKYIPGLKAVTAVYFDYFLQRSLAAPNVAGIEDDSKCSFKPSPLFPRSFAQRAPGGGHAGPSTSRPGVIGSYQESHGGEILPDL